MNRYHRRQLRRLDDIQDQIQRLRDERREIEHATAKAKRDAQQLALVAVWDRQLATCGFESAIIRRAIKSDLVQKLADDLTECEVVDKFGVEQTVPVNEVIAVFVSSSISKSYRRWQTQLTGDDPRLEDSPDEKKRQASIDLERACGFGTDDPLAPNVERGDTTLSQPERARLAVDRAFSGLSALVYDDESECAE